jgi:hypothetical protein
MSIDGLKQASPENVAELRRRLSELGLQVSASLRSPRNIRLRSLIESDRRYELMDAVEILERVDDTVPPPRQDVAAIIIWAGTQLADSSIEALHKAYLQLSVDVRHGATLVLSEILYEKVELFSGNKAENEIRKNTMGGSAAVHQALDQEVTHFQSVIDAAEILQELAAQVRVYHPPASLFIRPDVLHLSPQWVPYSSDPSGKLPLIDPGVNPAVKTIVITIAHGHPTGATHFPSLGNQSQEQVAARLRLGGLGNILRIPLQCYPQAAVRTWRELGGISESIHNDGRSDDLELNAWIASSLYNTVKTWIS